MFNLRIALFAGVIVIIAGIVIVSQRQNSMPMPKHVAATPGAVTYLPLGDSYTIGQSVAEDQRWPNQLAAIYKGQGIDLHILENPSVTGYTTQNLIDRELPLVPQLKPDVVSVLIGVNDYVQGIDAASFEHNFSYILDTLQKELVKPTAIFVVTIPDYAKTPTGAQYGDPQKATAAIEAFNAIIIKEARARNLPVIDIFGTSQAVTQDSTLTAADGLHPSGKQYGLWTTEIYKSLKQTTIIQKP